jgi:nucleotide-binding universal stress UspA family protein
MFQRILVPLDGSTRAESALQVAVRIARAYGGTLTLLQAVETIADHGAYLRPIIEEEKAEATAYLEGLAGSPELAGTQVEIQVPVGAVAPTIITAAQSSHTDLIIMSSHGYTGFRRWTLGSVAEKIARHAPVPLLILREGDTLSTPSPEKPVRALVPLDGSPFSEAVFEPAAYLVAGLASATSKSGELHLLRVIDLPLTSGRMRSQAYIDAQTEEKAREEALAYQSRLIERLDETALAGLAMKATSSVESDPDVAEAIVQQAEGAEKGKYDLIAMATHGRSGIGHFTLGSVTERVLHSTRLPLLVVRPPKPQSEPNPSEGGAGQQAVVTIDTEITELLC